jgi:hypothetical protein
MDEACLAEAVRGWRDHGWVLVEGLVPTADIDAALDDLWLVYPRPEDFHAAGDRSVLGSDRRRLRSPGDAPEEGKAMRAEQFLGLTDFPFPGSGRLNRLFVHPEIVRFAKAAMGLDDVRLYQMGLWAKYTGVANYDQPLHTDRNHAVVPVRMERGWWHLEGFLYLSDVTEGTGPTRLVSVQDSAAYDDRVGLGPILDGEGEDLYAAERAAPGVRGSFLAYRPDVWHRGADLTDAGGSRFLANISFKPGHHDWIGYFNPQPRSGLPEFARFMASCTPEELALLGVPRPGHPYWTEAVVDAMERRYPGIDMAPYRRALLPA